MSEEMAVRQRSKKVSSFKSNRRIKPFMCWTHLQYRLPTAVVRSTRYCVLMKWRRLFHGIMICKFWYNIAWERRICQTAFNDDGEAILISSPIHISSDDDSDNDYPYMVPAAPSSLNKRRRL